MQLRQIEVFCKVAELGSFTKAAEELFMSQPGVSFHIRALENHLGSSLFIRRSREIVLSEAGAIFYPYAAEALKKLNQGIAEAMTYNEQQKPVVHMGAGTNLAISYLLPAMGEFITQVGNVQIKLQTGVSEEIIQGLKDHQLDLGLVWGPLKGNEWCTHLVSMENWLLIYPPDSPLQKIDPESPEGISYLNQIPFVLPAPGASRLFVEKSLALCNIKPTVAMELRNAEAITDAVMNGNGVGLAPWKTIERRVKRGQLRYHDLHCDTKRQIITVYRKGDLQKKPCLEAVSQQIADRLSRFMKLEP